MATLTSLTKKRWIARGGLPLESLQGVRARTLAMDLARERGLSAQPTPYPMPPDMARAVQRVHAAMKSSERVGIFGDYDCDGITGVAQIVRYIRRCGQEPVVRLPHRVHDGYGLTAKIAEEWIEHGMSLLITVDTGITAIEPIALLQSKGIDVIVVDHHHVPEELPPAYAILHPGLTPGFSPPHPSGAGMAFLFLQGLEGPVWEDMHTDRALAMMGTVGDLVELRGINRQLVQDGLRSLQDLETGPLAKLREETTSGRITSTDVAFRIAPRLNAAGRMDDPAIALHALLQGGAPLERLHALNKMRQETTAHLVDQAFADIARQPTVLKASAHAEYPHGIIGLIAGRLAESTGCPSMIGVVCGDHITASLRSPARYHVTEGLRRISHLLKSFGGHAQAAGCSFPAEQWDDVCKNLEQDILTECAAEDFVPTIEVDALLPAEEVSLALATSLRQLEPFGQGNPEPKFLLRDVPVLDKRRVGDDGKHLQMRLGTHKAIAFGFGDHEMGISKTIDALCRIGINAWQGRAQVQLFVEDMQTRNA